MAFNPYIKMLSEGRFPFSTDADVNLFVHDTLHAVAFSALNSTPAARRIAEIARKRSLILYKVIERLRAEANFTSWIIESSATSVSSDPMERTMLLTILMTGNYKYFSPSIARSQGRLYSQQDPQITKARVAEVLNLISRGGADFYSFYEKIISQVSDSNQKILINRIFREETAGLNKPTETEIQAAASDIVQIFFAPKIFSVAEGIPLDNNPSTTVSGMLPYAGYPTEERAIPVLQ